MDLPGQPGKPHPSGLPWRPCVGVVLFNAAGLVWCGRRIAEGNTEYDGQPQLWQMPQGGLDPGEDAFEGAKRELFEETGVSSVRFLAKSPGWLRYDLPDTLIGTGLRGKYCGQTQKWFAFRFEGDDSEIRIDPPPGGHAAEFDQWAWKPLAELPGLIVPFKRQVYEQVVDLFRPFAA